MARTACQDGMMEQGATASRAIAAGQEAVPAIAAVHGAGPAPGVTGAAPGTGLRVFLVHAPEDAWFVDGFLLPALGLSEHEVLCSGKVELGAVIVQEIERGAVLPVTVVVVSPAFLASPWAQFANQLAVHHSVEAANDDSTTLVPVILADCELPLLSRLRAPLDFRDPARANWDAQVGKLRARLVAPVRELAPLPCPYPGLRPFTADDASCFHGRDKEIRDLLGRLRDGQRELYVIGPSGSGKSSLVAAGLVPRLLESGAPGRAGGSFLVRRLRPGADPATALARALEATVTELSDATVRGPSDATGRLLANHAEQDRLLIFVDQLEEIFTTASATARAQFFAAVRALRGEPRVAFVLTLRADFYASLMESTLWADLEGQLSRLDVGPLSGAQLQLAIEAPARALGVYFEPVLIERLLHDVASEPGALPLLQDTLLELWGQRTHGLLRLAEYDAMSDGARTGLAVTVARRADGALNALAPGQRDIARRVLLRLVQFGDGTATARRQQTRAALATAEDAPDQIDAVIRHLADWRLVITGGGGGDDDDASPRIDLAHEVLLSAWPRLGEWIRSRKQDERHRRTLEAKAVEWVSGGRGPYRLLDADELREARGWLSGDKARDLGVSEDLEGLLARSAAALAAQVAEADARRRRWRRWVMVALAGLIAAVAAIATLAVIAWQRSEEATAKAAVADAESRRSRQQLARIYVLQGHQRLMSGRPAEAVPYLVAAREAGDEIGDADNSLRRLFRWAVQGVSLQRFAHRGPVNAVAWSPDGKRVATASGDGTARVWDAASGHAVTPSLVHQGAVQTVTWSPDGARVATASEDGTARVWDAASGQVVTPPLVHEGHLRSAVWSPDGRQLATASEDGTVRVWDAVSGQVVTSLRHGGFVAAVAWSPDGRRVVTASDDGTARVWDAVRGQAVTPPLAHEGLVRAVAWRPDGTQIATASEDGTARIWDADSGHAVAALEHGNEVWAVAWRPDGRQVATASFDGTAQVWDAVTGQKVTPPLMHQGGVDGVVWSPDGRRVATASFDGTAQVWDAVTGQAVTPPFVHPNQASVHAVAWSPDGRWLATASEDGTARVWAVEGAPVTLPLESVNAVAWSPDGSRIAVAVESAWGESIARERDTVVGRTVELRGGEARAMAWSPDGTRIATAGGDHAAWVWDVASGQAVTPPLVHARPVNAVVWSPDGTRVATVSADDTAQVWDAVGGQAVTPPLAHRYLRAVAWRLDGRQVVTAGDDGTTRVWDAASGQPVTPMRELPDSGTTVALSPNGSRVVTSAGGTARVWDVLSGQAVTPLLAHPVRVIAMAWSLDGTRVAMASADGTARVWDAVTGQPVTPPLDHPPRREGPVAMAWSPDGRWVATARHEIVRVWDVASGQAVTPPLAQDRSIRAVTWNPDGRRVATLDDDGIVRVWDVSGDTGTLADWRAVLQRGDYRLNEAGVLVARDAKASPDPLPAAAAAR